jgi:magnesium-protoporphyrin O-methyltransferase
MNCCTPTGYRTIFGAKTVQRDARRYRRKGLTGSAGWLRDALSEDGVSERSVLEVGGGIGSLQIELLEAGASHATNVEAWMTGSSATSQISPCSRNGCRLPTS